MIDVKNKINSFFIFNSNFGPKEGEVSNYHNADQNTKAK